MGRREIRLYYSPSISGGVGGGVGGRCDYYTNAPNAPLSSPSSFCDISPTKKETHPPTHPPTHPYLTVEEAFGPAVPLLPLVLENVAAREAAEMVIVPAG